MDFSFDDTTKTTKIKKSTTKTTMTKTITSKTIATHKTLTKTTLTIYTSLVLVRLFAHFKKLS